MAGIRAMPLTANPILEDRHSLAFALLGNLRGHLRTSHGRRTHRHRIAITHHQHLINLDFFADLLIEPLDLNFVADFGSPRGMIVTSLSAPSDTVAGCLKSSGARCNVALARDNFGRYERHEWIDLLESIRWYGAGDPPSWYTATSPWHGDPEVLEAISGELTRIFGHPVPAETSPIYRELYLLPADDVLAFLARVPAGGVTPASFARWAADVASEWDRAHPRRLSNER